MLARPRSLRTAGVIFFGTPYRLGATVPIPLRTQEEADLWITLEGWDGSVHQASIPLKQASPATGLAQTTRRQIMSARLSNRQKRRLMTAGLVVLLGVSHQALAHNPMCECKEIEGAQIRCTGGFSDGSGAPGVTLDVIGYDETILVPGKLGPIRPSPSKARC